MPRFTTSDRAKNTLSIALAGCVMVLLSACKLLEAPSPPQTETVATVNGTAASDTAGYALLFDLLSDEKDVAKIRFIKRPRAPVTDLLKEISATSAAAHKELERFAKADKSLNLRDQRLPAGEMLAREAISKTKRNTLLSSKGKDLEVQLLLTQQQAMSYGAHLAQTLAKDEKNPSRQQFLEKLSEQLTGLETKLVSFLKYQYSFPE
jgi:hypothetical protein